MGEGAGQERGRADPVCTGMREAATFAVNVNKCVTDINDPGHLMHYAVRFLCPRIVFAIFAKYQVLDDGNIRGEFARDLWACLLRGLLPAVRSFAYIFIYTFIHFPSSFYLFIFADLFFFLSSISHPFASSHSFCSVLFFFVLL